MPCERPESIPCFHCDLCEKDLFSREQVDSLRADLAAKSELAESLNRLAGTLREENAVLKGELERLREEAVNAIPTSWLDPLLTGATAVIGSPPWSGPDIERLLRAIRVRIER